MKCPNCEKEMPESIYTYCSDACEIAKRGQPARESDYMRGVRAARESNACSPIYSRPFGDFDIGYNDQAEIQAVAEYMRLIALAKRNGVKTPVFIAARRSQCRFPAR